MKKYLINRFYNLEKDFIKPYIKSHTRNNWHRQTDIKLVGKIFLVCDIFLKSKFKY